MKKRILAMVFAALMALSLAACGGDAGAPAADEAQQSAQSSQGAASSGDTSQQEQPEQVDPVVLLEQDGLKVTYNGMSEDFLGPTVNLLIENNGSQAYTVQARDVSVNGFMIDPFFSVDVGPGKKANDTMGFLSDDISANGITEITDIEFTFHVCNPDTFDTIFDSDVITITP